MSRRSQAVQKAEEYYDSSEADAFYKNVWGGEDIHIGIYNTPDEEIAQASRRTVETMALQIPGLGRKTRILDLGAGYGGSARHLAGTYGCHVTCLNLSETQNDLNRDKNVETDLDALIDVVHGSFEDIPAEDASVDLVWSQDAILHSGDRPRVLDEISRVLAPGGHV
ncbi:MAG: class I SAM-dependent methyltransferase, partial [Nisaea sp.]|uniref:SAM-dependent methyltransferase n=1 Tax=Nisaea sp. TaxID=2024842 RepID=UPI003264FF0A